MNYGYKKIFGLNINVNKNKIVSSKRHNSDRYIDFIISHHINYNTIIFKPIVNKDIYTLHSQINYNISPIIKGKGSAIFLHLTNNYKPTAGCVALKKKDFEILLKLIDKNTKIKIG